MQFEIPKNNNWKFITERDDALIQAVALQIQPSANLKKAFYENVDYSAYSRRICKLARRNIIVKIKNTGNLQIGLGENGADYLVEIRGYKRESLLIQKPRTTQRERRKLKKNSFIVLTESEIKILEHLACGISTSPALIKFYRKKDGGYRNVRHAYRRIAKAVNAGYIKKISFGSFPQKIYLIDELGIEYLTCNMGYNADRIRSNEPGETQIAHELMISDIVRSIKKEEDMLLYKVEHLYDDNYMRTHSRHRKGAILPDLNLRITTPDGSKYTYHIEVDTGKRPVSSLIEKILQYPSNTLVIVPHTSRKNNVQKALLMTRDTKCIDKTFFAIASDVIKEGLMRCKSWKTATKRPAVLL